ncbi:hypothetical protein AGLY_002815 [Aphis glycines]|uniref:Uncharacterized protein n=1 Tax=Aphis glycines TaxID=307491 RepID=A0A6G0U1F8_APHGL|nr:hypothetical protein AGLY_002815 [Aphis glycines]
MAPSFPLIFQWTIYYCLIIIIRWILLQRAAPDVLKKCITDIHWVGENPNSHYSQMNNTSSFQWYYKHKLVVLIIFIIVTKCALSAFCHEVSNTTELRTKKKEVIHDASSFLYSYTKKKYGKHSLRSVPNACFVFYKIINPTTSSVYWKSNEWLVKSIDSGEKKKIYDFLPTS